MLHLSPSSHKLSRAQGTLVDDKEIRRVVRFLKDIAAPSFERSLMQVKGGMDENEERIYLSENNSSASLKAAQEDPMFDRAVEIVLETKRGSVSLLQRRLAIGYTRASRLIDLMGIAGILSDHKGSVARDVMISIEEWDAMKDLVAEDQRRLAAQGQGVSAEPEDPHQTTMFIDENAGELDEDPPFDTDESVAGVVVHGTIDAEDDEEEDEIELEDEYEEEEEDEEELDEDEEESDEDEDEDEDEEEVDEEVEVEDEEDEDEEEVEYEYVDEDGNPIDPEDLEDDEYEIEDSDEEDEEEDEEEEYEESDEYEEDEYEEDEHPTTESVR